MNDLEILLESIQRGVILGPTTFDNVEAERILSNRDQPAFEGAWLKTFDEVKNVPLSAEQSVVIDRIREAAYKATFGHTANPELSGYISDDFEIIAKGIASGLENTFLNGLFKAYAENSVPGGTTPSSEQQSLASLVNQLRQRL